MFFGDWVIDGTGASRETGLKAVLEIAQQRAFVTLTRGRA